LYIFRRAAFLSHLLFTQGIFLKKSPQHRRRCHIVHQAVPISGWLASQLSFGSLPISKLVHAECQTGHREPLRLGSSLLLVFLRGHSILFSRILVALSPLARVRKFFITLTTRRRPPSTASSTPFHQSACRTRGGPRSRRLGRCASRRKASTKRDPGQLFQDLKDAHF
jgi:hypothetical protein